MPAPLDFYAEELRGMLRRAWAEAERSGRRLGLRPGEAIPIVYAAEYTPPDHPLIDPRRGARVLGHLLDEGWIAPGQVQKPPRLEVHDLRRVHDDEYLASLDAPATLERIVGGSVTAADAARLVRAQRAATAGTLLGTRFALERGAGAETGRLAVNLGGGFHHARRNRGEGFCIFNDVAVAIEHVRAQGFGGRVLVVDLDLHQGNGTRAIYADDERVFTFSVHASPWDDEPAVANLDVALGPGIGDATYLDAVRAGLEEAFAKATPDLVFYVAGMDVAADDRLGSWQVTPDGILERDRLVLERVGARPCVMTLSGGYGPDAWRYTARTLVWLEGGGTAPIPSRNERGFEQFRRVARSLGQDDLGAGPDAPAVDDGNFGITEADLLGSLVQKRERDRLLDYYTVYGLELALERYGVLEHLHRRGYAKIDVEIDALAPRGQTVTLRADEADRPTLIELVVEVVRLGEDLRFISVEWLLLQDPKALPPANRPLLPGQVHPGLGCLKLIVGMLTMACERLGYDGLTFIPAHYHVAAQARDLLRFAHPEHQARFMALAQALEGVPLARATAYVDEGRVVDRATGQPVAWHPERMILPVSEAARTALAGPAYVEALERHAGELAYVLR